MLVLLKTILAKLCDINKDVNWDDLLPLVSALFNNRIDRNVGLSKFNMMYNRNANEWDCYSDVVDNIDVASWLAHLKNVESTVIPKIVELKKDAKKVGDQEADKRHRVDKPFIVGDKVMQVNNGRKSKNEALYKGPFIIHCVIDNCYILKDTYDRIRVKPVPHDQLKSAAFVKLESLSDDLEYPVDFIIDHQESKVKKNITWCLIRWLDYDYSYDSWVKVNDVGESLIEEYEERGRKPPVQYVHIRSVPFVTKENVVKGRRKKRRRS